MIISKLFTEIEKKYLKADGSIDFKEFALLPKSEQIACMASWTPKQKMEYLMQNTISEDECLAPIIKLIDEIEQGKYNL